MRIARLELRAFGPFTGVTLDLSAGAPGGLHVIYGPNEAGKSSARRALADLLFGFEQRTGDAHRHRYEALRIAAVLTGPEGELFVERRKARKGSLRDAAGEVLDDALLERLLGGVDRATFARTFGLGHEELRTGGEEMLRGEASVGETLFDAGAGGPGVKRLREALVQEEERLYRPRGKQQELNQLLERHAEARRRCQEAVLLPESHREQEETLAAARRELAVLSERLESLRAEQYRLIGLSGALPALTERVTATTELEGLAGVPLLAEDARERRERAQARELEARAAAERLTEELARGRARRDELVVPAGLATIGAGRIAALADAVGRTRKARANLPRIENERRRLSSEMRASLRRLGRDADRAPPLEVPPAEGARIRKLATLRDKLDERVTLSHARLAATRRDLAEQRLRLERLPPTMHGEALSRALSLARSLGDVEAPLAELERDERALEREFSRKLRDLKPFAGDASALEALEVPSAEAVERLSADAARLEADERALSDEKAGLARRLADVTARLGALAGEGTLPSEAELFAVRTERDGAADRLRATWNRGAAFDEVGWRGFTDLGSHADGVADRLRREADRVAARAQAESERAALAGEATRVQDEKGAVAVRRAAHERALGALAASLSMPVPSPPELLGWLARREQVLELLERRRRLTEQSERLVGARRRLDAALSAALGGGAPDDLLSSRVERAASLEREEGRRASERREVERSIDALEARLGEETLAAETAEGALADWRVSWAEALGALGAGSSLEPEAALVVLAELSALSERSDRIQSLEHRVLGIQRDEARLAAEVAEPAVVFGVTVDPAEPDRAAEEVVELHRRATNAADERARLETELAEREAELAGERQTLSAARAELAELCRAAGASEPAELAVLEARSLRRRELTRRVEELDAALVASSKGRPVADLLKEAEHETAPRLHARLDEIERELGELDEQRGRSLDQVASIQAGLARQSAAEGADAVQDEQALAAAVRERIERYARLRVASSLLERAVERYRLANQGPVLKRAGELFARLTAGAYVTLRVGREEAAIAAVAPDGRELLPDQLSEGTRYQLYLALRLASIERHAETADTLPLVLDDAIIHFDEARKHAAFGLFGELAERHQILFFTHLEHDVAIARAALGDRAFFHELGPR